MTCVVSAIFDIGKNNFVKDIKGTLQQNCLSNGSGVS
jgi:hypothetical protein